MKNVEEENIQSCSLESSSLQRKCSRDHILEIAKFISWEDVGCYLPGIERGDLEDIKKNFHNQQMKRRELLYKWEEGLFPGGLYIHQQFKITIMYERPLCTLLDTTSLTNVLSFCRKGLYRLKTPV